MNATATTAMEQEPLTIPQVFHTWWPLAVSWALMAIEPQIANAVISRFPHAREALASFGGLLMPVVLAIEAPVLMFLPASTALSRDRHSYVLLYRFMMWTGALLTAVHLLIAATPLYGWLLHDVLGAPLQLVEPTRLGMFLFLPFTWAIAHRRFQQGILIRSGMSRVVGAGTVVRLCTQISVIAFVSSLGATSGLNVAAFGTVSAVLAEMLFVALYARRPIEALKRIEPTGSPLTLPTLLRFYLPLSLTSMLALLLLPLGSAALTRMPQPIDSLAVWPVVSGIAFLFRSATFSFTEVVVALIERPGARVVLRSFLARLATLTTALMLVTAGTPLSEYIFHHAFALPEELAALARIGMLIAVLMPPLTAAHSWYQGLLLHKRHPRTISVGVFVNLVSSAAVLYAGTRLWPFPGVFLCLAAFVVGMAMQALVYRIDQPGTV